MTIGKRGLGCTAAGIVALSMGCAAEPPPPPAAPPPPPAPVAPPVVVRPIERPASVAMWAHAEEPAKLAAVVAPLDDGKNHESCVSGNLIGCIFLTDLRGPADLVETSGEAGARVEAAAFSVRSAADFRVAAVRDAHVVEAGPGRLKLEANKVEGAAQGGDSSTSDKSDAVVCDVSAADTERHRVVCGTEAGLSELGPWLMTSPRPTPDDGLARVEIYPGPAQALADRELKDPTRTQSLLLDLAHDFTGATVRFSGTEGPDARLAVDVDLHLKVASRTSQIVFTPPASPGAVPEAFARLGRGATAAIYLPGGGPLPRAIDELDPTHVALLEKAGQHAALVEAREVLQRPAACGYVVDLEAGEQAVAQARKAPPKDPKATHAALEAAFEGFVVCAVTEDPKAAEPLARKLVAVTPAKKGAVTVFRPAGGLGLPKGAFVVETTTRPEPSATKPAKGAKPAAPTVDATLVVPDGETTWVVGAGAHTPAAARLAKRLLARPRGPVTSFVTPPGTFASVTVNTLFGAFFEDLAKDDVDALGKTLGASSLGALQLALSEHTEGDAGTLSLHAEGAPATLATIGPRLLLLAVPIGLVVGMSLAAADK